MCVSISLKIYICLEYFLLVWYFYELKLISYDFQRFNQYFITFKDIGKNHILNQGKELILSHFQVSTVKDIEAIPLEPLQKFSILSAPLKKFELPPSHKTNFLQTSRPLPSNSVTLTVGHTHFEVSRTSKCPFYPSSP